MNELNRIRPRKMVILGVGWFGMAFFWGFHIGSMPLFLKNFTDSKFIISFVLSFAGVAGCIVPPLVGHISDRTFTRFGRRKPYIFCGMLGVFICLLGLPHAAAFGMVALVSAVMYLSIAFAETPYLSLLPDITPRQQRSTVSGVVHLFGNIGLITCFAVGTGIWGEHPVALLKIAAVVSFGSVLIAITLIREPQGPQAKPTEGRNPIGDLRELAKEANVLTFFAAQFSWWVGFYMISSFLTLFLVEELNVTEESSLLAPMVLSIVSTIFMIPMGALGDRHGRKRILSIMLAFWTASGILVGLSQNLTHALITAGLAGIPSSAVIAVGYACMLDLIPKERTAGFVGMSVASIGAAGIFGPLIGGKAIDGLGYRSVFPVAAMFMLVGLVILQFVKHRRTEHLAEQGEVS